MKRQLSSSLTWRNPLEVLSSSITHVFRLQVEEFLARAITKGSLTITRTDDDNLAMFGETPSAAHDAERPVVNLHLVNAASFYARIATQSDIGFAEAYMAGDFTVASDDHLLSVFRLLILNRDDKSPSAPVMLLSRIGAAINFALHTLNRNTISGSRRNINAHYDLSNALFGTFLGKTWMYSCALFSKERCSLDEAQIAKIDAILTKVRIMPGNHILDIGCGWGEFAIFAASKYDCTVTAITLSTEQYSLARERARAAGVANRITFELVDYRNLAARGIQYDRIVSIEMIEAVGHEFLGSFFKALDTMLSPDGLAVVQVISTPDSRYDRYRRGTDFIQKHIFPGGICPSLSAMTMAMAHQSDLVVEHLENIGPHYATTLAEWRRRFVQSVKNGDVQRAGFDNVFIRKWIYYFCYCESGFSTRTLGVLQLVLSHVGNLNTLGKPPPTCSF